MIKLFLLNSVWWYHQLLSGYLANDNLPRMSRQSRLLANDKDENEIIPGAVPRSPGIYLTADENPDNTSARREPEKAVRPVIVSNEVPYLQMR